MPVCNPSGCCWDSASHQLDKDHAEVTSGVVGNHTNTSAQARQHLRCPCHSGQPSNPLRGSRSRHGGSNTAGGGTQLGLVNSQGSATNNPGCRIRKVPAPSPDATSGMHTLSGVL